MNRLEWVLSGLLALLFVVVAVMALLLWGIQREQQIEFSPGVSTEQSEERESERSAQAAYRLAEPVAQQWAADAQMVTARTNWPEGTNFPAQERGWEFIFYSPTRSATAVIDASEGNARLVRSAESDRPVVPISLETWEVDSPAVMETVLENGGREFLETHNQVSVFLTLNAVDLLQWRARLIDRETQEIMIVEINPANGAVTAVNRP